MSNPGRPPSIPGRPHWSASSSSRMKWTSPRSRLPGTTGRPTARPHLQPGNLVRLHHETTSYSKPAFSVPPLECDGRSFFMRTARSCRPISSASRACGTATRRTLVEMEVVNDKLRKAIESEGRVARIEGLWWQFSVTERSTSEPSAVSLLRVSRDHDGALELAGRSWQEDGSLSARYWSEASKEKKDAPGIFYYWKGERPRHPNAPQLDGTGEIRMESPDRATGYFTTRSDAHPKVNTRTSGVYLRADPGDLAILDGRDDRKRAALIAERLRDWKSITNA